jgi:hypothetical protein
MAKIKILKVLNKDEVSKAGKPYTQCSIKTLDKTGQEVWVNGFGNNTTKSWSEGQEIELDIYQEEYQGKMRLKFRDVKEVNLAQEIAEIKKLVKEIYAIVTFDKLDKPAKVSDVVEKKDEEEQRTAEIVPEIPF